MVSLVQLVDFALCFLAVYLGKTIWFSKSKKPVAPLPPGPRPKPLIGNLLDLPKEYDWLHWAQHKSLYGPISSISVMGKNIVIVNDAKIAMDILDKRSAVYSDRPAFPFGGEMCGWENTLALQHYGPRFRAYRKNIAQTLGTRHAIAKFHPLEEIETRRFLVKVLCGGSEQLIHAIRTTAGAIILRISHGYNIEHHAADPLVDLADEALVQFSLSTIPGTWMVDVMPFLKYIPEWFPGTAFQRTAKRWSATLTDLAEKPHAFVKQRMAQGAAEHSYTSALLEGLQQSAKGADGNAHAIDGLTEEEFVIKWSAASMYSGGADTTVSAIYSFYLAMVQYPEVLRKAQAEIDSVVGTDRLPSFSDRPNLPYVEALVKEVLRWKPVAPMGLPHVNVEDDIVNGYLIPKGSLVMANIWLFTHDPENFHDPMKFEPERFLVGGTGKGGQPEMDTHDLSFGFGRRICPGKELADASVFISIAMSLAAFNISKVVDSATGEEIEPVSESTSGVISHPKEFKCKIVPRSRRAEELILSVEEEHPYGTSDAANLQSVKW